MLLITLIFVLALCTGVSFYDLVDGRPENFAAHFAFFCLYGLALMFVLKYAVGE